MRLSEIQSSRLSNPLTYLVRFESLFCLFIILLVLLLRNNPYLVYPRVLYLLLVLLGLNFAAVLVSRFARFGRAMTVAVILAECGTIAAILSSSGEHASNLWVLFLLPIYTACLHLDGGPIAWITIGAIACNVVYYFFAISTSDWDSSIIFELATKSVALIFAAGATWNVALKERSSQLMLERTENYMYLFRRLVGQMDDAILVINPGTGHLVDINGTWSRSLGYGRDEFKSVSLADFKGFLPAGMVWKDFVLQIEEKKFLRFECNPRRKDGISMPMEIHIQCALQEDKTYLIAVARDISERKRAESQLRHAQDQIARSEKLAAIGRLASGVGHELRNPLSAIKNALYYFKEVSADQHLDEKDSGLTDVLMHAGKEIDIASNIISDLLDFARVVRIKPEPTYINELVAEARKDFEVRDDVRIIEHYGPDIPPIPVDRQKLHQVIVNLANNGIQAMPSGGELEVSTRLDTRDGDAPSQVLIIFKDSGVGIAPEDMGKLFEPLFTTKPKGTGLGLNISLSIVQAHKGDIGIESEPGHGSIFTIRLPLTGPEIHA